MTVRRGRADLGSGIAEEQGRGGLDMDSARESWALRAWTLLKSPFAFLVDSPPSFIFFCALCTSRSPSGCQFLASDNLRSVTRLGWVRTVKEPRSGGGSETCRAMKG